MRAKIACLFFFVFFSCGTYTEEECIDELAGKLTHMRIIAHRGVTATAEENSLQALTKAAEMKVDAVEFDVMLSKDGELMVFHDSLLFRMTGRGGRIQDFPKDTLMSFPLKNRMGDLSVDCIPSLDDVLDSLGGQIHCYVEMKLENRGLEKKLVEMVEKRNIVHNVTIQSFNNESLKRVHALNPEIALCYLIYDNFRPPCVEGPKEEFDHVQRFGIYHGVVNMEILKNMKEYYGKEVDLYTVDDCRDLKVAYCPYVDGLITNEPAFWLTMKKM